DLDRAGLFARREGERRQPQFVGRRLQGLAAADSGRDAGAHGRVPEGRAVRGGGGDKEAGRAVRGEAAGLPDPQPHDRVFDDRNAHARLLLLVGGVLERAVELDDGLALLERLPDEGVRQRVVEGVLAAGVGLALQLRQLRDADVYGVDLNGDVTVRDR